MVSNEPQVIRQELANTISDFLAGNFPSDFKPLERIFVINNLDNFNDDAKKYEESIWKQTKDDKLTKYDVYWDDTYVCQIKATDTKRQCFVIFLEAFLDLYKNDMVFLSKHTKTMHDEKKAMEARQLAEKKENDKKEIKKMAVEVAEKVRDRS